MEKQIKLIKEYFKQEDEVLKKVDSKFSNYMITRNISHKVERKELLNLRKKLIEDSQKLSEVKGCGIKSTILVPEQTCGKGGWLCNNCSPTKTSTEEEK